MKPGQVWKSIHINPDQWAGGCSQCGLMWSSRWFPTWREAMDYVLEHVKAYKHGS